MQQPVVNQPAAWYPQPDGQQRYWDGEQWTQHFAPGGPPVPASVAATSAVDATGKAARPWFKKKRFVIPGIALAIIVAANLGGGGTDSTNLAAVDNSTAATGAVQPKVVAPADQAAADKAAADQAAADKAAAAKAAADQATADKVAAAKAAADKAAAAKAAAAAAAPQLGKTVRDGKFAFTVTAVKCGIAQVGTNEFLIQKAQGQYCRVSLKVENIGDEAQMMFASNQYLFDTKGRKFSADATANIYDDSAKLMFEEINPGNSIKGFVYFDVPKGTKISKLELHDSMFSGGVEVRL